MLPGLVLATRTSSPTRIRQVQMQMQMLAVITNNISTARAAATITLPIQEGASSAISTVALKPEVGGLDKFVSCNVIVYWDGCPSTTKNFFFILVEKCYFLLGLNIFNKKVHFTYLYFHRFHFQDVWFQFSNSVSVL